MRKLNSIEINNRNLPCQLCEKWNERAKECKCFYGYAGDTRCDTRKAQRNEDR